jgi:hypothetical protein
MEVFLQTTSRFLLFLSRQRSYRPVLPADSLVYLQNRTYLILARRRIEAGVVWGATRRIYSCET